MRKLSGLLAVDLECTNDGVNLAERGDDSVMFMYVFIFCSGILSVRFHSWCCTYKQESLLIRETAFIEMATESFALYFYQFQEFCCFCFSINMLNNNYVNK